jgi:hypothetical protein
LTNYSDLVGGEIVVSGQLGEMRDLGRLAFLKLLANLKQVQVVVDEKETLKNVRRLQKYASIRVFGTVQKKYNRKPSERIEYEIYARRIELVGEPETSSDQCSCEADRYCGPVENSEPLRHFLTAQGAAREILGKSGYLELPGPSKLDFRDLQGALSVLRITDTDGLGDLSIYPAFQFYSKRLASAGFHHFFCFIGGFGAHPQLLHITSCFLEGEKLRELVEKIVLEIVGLSRAGLSEPSIQSNGRGFSTDAEFSDIAGTWVNHSSISYAEDGGTADLGIGAFCRPVHSKALEAYEGRADRWALAINGVAVAHYAGLNSSKFNAEKIVSSAIKEDASRNYWRAVLCDGLTKSLPPLSTATILISNILLAVGESSSDIGGSLSSTEMNPECRVWLRNIELNTTQATELIQGAFVEQLASDDERLISVQLSGLECSVKEAATPMQLQAAFRCIGPSMEEFQLDACRAEKLIGLLKILQPDWNAISPVHLFQLMWSMLGNESIRKIMSDDEAVENAKIAVGLNVITDKTQLYYVDKSALRNLIRILVEVDEHARGIDQILVYPSEQQKKMCTVLRQILGRRPRMFSNVLEVGSFYITNGRRSELIWMLDSSTIFPICDLGLVTPIFMQLLHSVGPSKHAALFEILAQLGGHILPNIPIDRSLICEQFCGLVARRFPEHSNALASIKADELAAELIYFFFQPITLSFSELTEKLSDITDSCADVQKNGIRVGGETWSRKRQCYSYALTRNRKGVGRLDLYLSKNVASFFAKASAGICTDINTELYARPDHLHLNMVDGDSGRVVGNVQLYVCTDGGCKFLLIRGINPCATYAADSDSTEILRIVLHCVVVIARVSGFDEVRVSEQLGLWNATSSRAEIRVALHALVGNTNPILLKKPVLLYNYYGKKIEVHKVFSIWKLLECVN